MKEIEIFDELMDELDAKSKSTNQDDDFVMVGDNDNVAELVKCKDAEGGFIVVDDAAMDKDGNDDGSLVGLLLGVFDGANEYLADRSDEGMSLIIIIGYRDTFDDDSCDGSCDLSVLG